jgi:hypothetical protein
MNHLNRQVLNKAQDCVDSLYGVENQLRIAKRSGTLGEMVSLATRKHIYYGCTEVIRRYKYGEDYEILLERTIKRIMLHTDQIKRLRPHNIKQNLMYMLHLMKLMVLFRR